MMPAMIKNGKDHAFHIFILILIFICTIPYIIYASAPGVKNDGKWVIVIDPGHGGRDSGAQGSKTKEKDINLAIALKTGEYIRKNIPNTVVVFTRTDDSTVDLIERPRIANRNNADLFLSIHANWAKVPGVMGSETFIMGLSKDQANLEVAMKENEVIYLEEDFKTKYQGFDPKSPESYIMFSLMQNVFKEQSTDLASRIQTQFRERVSRKDRGVKQERFWVLYNTTMPSVLIETGFITNPNEERYLNSLQGQDLIASAIFRACRDYMNEIDARSIISSTKSPELEILPSKSDLAVPASQITFMVQIATSSIKNETNPENFKGLSGVIEINAGDRYKYATGSFLDYTDAVKYRKKIESIYPDAFVIAVKENKILPLQQALEQIKKK